MEQIKGYVGNKEILNQHKTAFLCSKRCPAEVILRAYDWAIEQRDKGNCIIIGAHSKIEMDVYDLLLKGKQPLIKVLARGMKKTIETTDQNAIDNKRLLIISPFEDKVKRVNHRTAEIRNDFMADLADEIFIAFAAKDSNTEKLIKKFEGLKKITMMIND